MKIQYASDIHLEFSQNSRFLQENPLTVIGDILVLAGDISYLGDKKLNKSVFWDWTSDNFRQTYIVPGNHEYYGGFELSETLKDFIYDIRDNVRYINNHSITEGYTELFFTTLWSSIPFQKLWHIETGMMDCQRIRYNGNKFSAIHYDEIHRKCFDFIRLALSESRAKKKIVVSHTVPTELCIPKKYKDSQLNPAFVVELHDFIFDSGIDYWLYGHSHYNMPETVINKTRLLCNQLGYVKYNEHLSFRNDVVVEL